MSWKDRLRECVYSSPSGIEFTLLFDEVSREVGKKAPVTEFPGQNSGAVQDLGQATARYPMNLYLGGEDYDLEADRFWAALNEPGIGELRHPRFGNIPVVPVSVSQTEQFVDGAGRATFVVEFVESIESRLEYPAGGAISADALSGAADAVSLAGEQLLEGIVVDDPIAAVAIQENSIGLITKIKNAFNTVTSFTDEVRSEINAFADGIIREIDELVAAPANLLQSLSSLYRLPAAIVGDVEGKVRGYASLINGIGGQFADTTSDYAELFGLIDEANISAAAGAAAEASGYGTVSTSSRSASIIDLLAGIQDTAGSFGGNDYELTRLTKQATTLAQQAQRELLSNLPIEQQTTLEADEVLILLVDRLYTRIDDLDQTLADFIEFNDLQGESILMVPAGTVVRWYE